GGGGAEMYGVGAPPPVSVMGARPSGWLVQTGEVLWPGPLVGMPSPPPPVSELFRALPVRVSPWAPPMTFSIVAPDERVRVNPALTTCAAGLLRLTVTARVVVAEKSRVSIPPPASLISEERRAGTESRRWGAAHGQATTR